MTAPRTVVIVGGVAGGMSAATRLRRNDEQARIIVLEQGPYVSFANCGLPYFVGGVIGDRDALLLQTPESLAARFALDVRVNTQAVSIDPDELTVTARDVRTGAEEIIAWDELILAPGAEPITPPLPGIERAHVLRDVPDADALVASISGGGRDAVILGGGFIGLELAENLVERGLRVTIVELADQILAPLDVEMARRVEAHLRDHGVELRLGRGAAAIHDDAVELSDGTRVRAELVIAAVGVRPRSELARDAGLTLDARGGIVVDDHQRTSHPHIYAVGDAAVKRDAIDDALTLVPLAQTANRHGRLVADIICGRDVAAQPVLSTAVVGVFGMTVATTGWNERRARAAGLTPTIVHTHPADHAGYYPGAEQMSLKLVFEPGSARILGAQGVGGAGVDKRIDVIATAMRGGLTAPQLADLELAYAPQFGSAKDPVNMLGMVADNLDAGVVRSVQWHELDDAVRDGAVVLDVRSEREFANGAIEGALNVPLDDIRERIDEVPDAPLIVHCEVGVRANVAARLLTHLGRDVRVLDGSLRTYRPVGRPLVASVASAS